MTSAYSPPPLRNLPPGGLERRRKHLLAEIARESERGSRFFGFAFPRPRPGFIAGLAGVGVVVGAAALALSLTGGSSAPADQPFLVQAIHGPAWGAYTRDWGGFDPNCASIAQHPFGCDGMIALSSAPAPRTSTPQSGRQDSTEIAGGTAEQQSLLRAIVGNMRPTAITTIAIRPSNSDVVLRMDAPDTSMRTLWEETLIAGAFRDRSKIAGQPVAVALENGESSGIIPPGPMTPLLSARPGDEEKTRRVLATTADKLGASLDELTIYRPSGIAVAVTLKTGDPATFLVHAAPRFLAAIGDLWRDYDGVYVRLVDGSGATVWETSTAGRTSTGAVGSRADLAGCSPIANWGPTPAPCPVR